MITCDLACLVLVLAMTVPGLPLGVLTGLLFAVSLALAPFLSARMAVNREVLGAARFPLGNGITQATYQVGTVAGFALGGLVVAAAGYRTGLLIDAATFAVSAAVIRAGVRPRPAPGGPGRPERPEYWAGARAVLASPAAVTAMGLMWLAAFYNAPEGAATPLAAGYGGERRRSGGSSPRWPPAPPPGCCCSPGSGRPAGRPPRRRARARRCAGSPCPRRTPGRW